MLWGLPVWPSPAVWGSPSGLEHGARSCWGCGVGGCSPFWVFPKGREPQEFLNLGVGVCLLPGRRQELLELKAVLAGMGWGCWIGGPRLGGTQMWFKALWKGLVNPLSVFSSFFLRPAS